MKRWLHTTFVDLGEPAAPDYLQPHGVALAFRAFVSSADLPRFFSYHPGLRIQLRRELGDAVVVDTPLDVPPPDRSPRWSTLCDAVANADDLADDAFDRLLWLLLRLGFAELVTALDAGRRCDDPVVASSVAYTAAHARYAATLNTTGRHYMRPFRDVLAASRPGTMARVHASYHLAQAEAKGARRVEHLRALLARHRREIDDAAPSLSRHDRLRVLSRFHRVGAFLPQLEGRHDAMTAAMDLSAAVAAELAPADAAEEVCAREIIWPINESRVKEAYVRGDLDRAEAAARRLVADDGMGARAHFHLGSVLIDRDRREEAAASFQRVVRLGPWGTEIAHFYLGQLAEAAGDHDRAANHYLDALRIDPLSVSALDALRALPGALPGAAPEPFLSLLARRQHAAAAAMATAAD